MLLFLNKHVAQANLEQVKVAKFEWLQSIHMYYPQDNIKNKNKILQQFTNLGDEEQIELEKCCKRLEAIFENGTSKNVK